MTSGQKFTIDSVSHQFFMPLYSIFAFTFLVPAPDMIQIIDMQLCIKKISVILKAIFINLFHSFGGKNQIMLKSFQEQIASYLSFICWERKIDTLYQVLKRGLLM